MIFKDYYSILGLKNNKVSIDEIKVAYRNQAKKYHPDVNIGNTENEEKFKDINEAYKTLSTPASKRKYDRTWIRHVRKSNNIYEKKEKDTETSGKKTVFNEFINLCFGNVKVDDEKKITNSVPAKGENIKTEVSVSIEDAFRGKEQSIALRTVDGNLKTIKVNLPAGIQNNEKIRLIGQGKLGKNGGKNGDLYIQVKIRDDNKFKLEGYNLRTNLYLTPWEAALSTKVTISGIDEDISVYIPKGIQSGEIITIENMGYKDGKGGRGNLLLETQIMIPKHLNEKEKELFSELNKISKFNPRKFEI